MSCPRSGSPRSTDCPADPRSLRQCLAHASTGKRHGSTNTTNHSPLESRTRVNEDQHCSQAAGHVGVDLHPRDPQSLGKPFFSCQPHAATSYMSGCKVSGAWGSETGPTVRTWTSRLCPLGKAEVSPPQATAQAWEGYKRASTLRTKVCWLIMYCSSTGSRAGAPPGQTMREHHDISGAWCHGWSIRGRV